MLRRVAIIERYLVMRYKILGCVFEESCQDENLEYIVTKFVNKIKGLRCTYFTGTEKCLAASAMVYAPLRALSL